MADEAEVHNVDAANRFEMERDGKIAFLEYRRVDGVLNLLHTVVPSDLENQGIGSSLANYALEFARTNDLKVVPTCSFVAAYLESHPEYSDLVA